MYTKDKIDFETIETIDINLIAYDTGHPQLSTTATIFIKVININDNSPIFNQVWLFIYNIIFIWCKLIYSKNKIRIKLLTNILLISTNKCNTLLNIKAYNIY